MNVKFNEVAKEAIEKLIQESSEKYIRIKVFYGCGRPAYDIYPSLKAENDIEEEIEGIKFVVDKKDYKACDDIEIKYDKELYNNGFYIR